MSETVNIDTSINKTVSSLLLFDKSLVINGYPTVRINYDININNLTIDDIKTNIDKTMFDLKDTKSTNKFILLLDFNSVNKTNLNISKFKAIIMYVQEKYLDKLYKCIIYNYTRLWKFIIDMLMNVIDEESKNKIILKKDLEL